MQWEYITDILKVAITSSQGMLALAMIILGMIATRAIDTNEHPKYNILIIALVVVSFGVGFWSFRSASFEVAPPSAKQPGNASGYIYYEVAKDGGTTTDGRLILIENGSEQNESNEYSSIESGAVLKATGDINDGLVDGAYIRAEPTGSSSIEKQLTDSQCVSVTRPRVKEITSFQNPDVSSGGWLGVKTIACPD